MPTVGGTKFPYTKEGMAKAKAWSEMTGKPMKMEKSYSLGGKIKKKIKDRKIKKEVDRLLKDREYIVSRQGEDVAKIFDMDVIRDRSKDDSGEIAGTESPQAARKRLATKPKSMPGLAKPKGKPEGRYINLDIPRATTAVDKTQGIPTEGSSAKDMQILAEILKYGAVPPTIGLGKILSEQFAEGGDIPQYGLGGWLKRITNPAGAKRWWNKNIKPLGKIRFNDLNPYNNKKAAAKKAIDPNLYFAKQKFGSGSNITDLLSSLASGKMEMGGEVPAGRRMYGMGGNTKKKRKK